MPLSLIVISSFVSIAFVLSRNIIVEYYTVGCNFPLTDQIPTKTAVKRQIRLDHLYLLVKSTSWIQALAILPIGCFTLRFLQDVNN